MNIKLLRRIQKQILKEPRQFDMSWWFTPGKDIPNCGTAACIAGWAVALSKNKTPDEARRLHFFPGDKARSALKISLAQGCNLFHDSCWPTRFRTAFREANNPEKEAKIAAARIEHFIKTKGE